MAKILKTISMLSPAKLNLFLHIVGRHPTTGYHHLETLFQLVNLCDEMTFRTTAEPTLSIEGMQDVPFEQNLIFQAAKMLFEKFKVQTGVHIKIIKRIPMGGGLGGGSSNAATTLLALNYLWALNQSIATLAEIGLSLGADVPVFIQGRTAWAKGVGELIEPVDLPKSNFIIIFPRIAVSTKLIFEHPHLKRDTLPIPLDITQLQQTRNDCEPIATNLFPEIQEVLAFLQAFGSARLTGTGSCCFLSVETLEKGEKILQYMPHRWIGFLVESIPVSPSVITLQALQQNKP